MSESDLRYDPTSDCLYVKGEGKEFVFSEASRLILALPPSRPDLYPDKTVRAETAQDVREQTRHVWRDILWPWCERYKGDRNVTPLFLRSDVVLHMLAHEIGLMVQRAREDGMAGRLMDEKQRERFETWRKEQDALTVERQRARGSTHTHAYHGAIGGSCTFEQTPTTLGTTLKVYYARGTANEAVIDLTDYEDW